MTVSRKICEEVQPAPSDYSQCGAIAFEVESFQTHDCADVFGREDAPLNFERSIFGRVQLSRGKLGIVGSDEWDARKAHLEVHPLDEDAREWLMRRSCVAAKSTSCDAALYFFPEAADDRHWSLALYLEPSAFDTLAQLILERKIARANVECSFRQVYSKEAERPYPSPFERFCLRLESDLAKSQTTFGKILRLSWQCDNQAMCAVDSTSEDIGKSETSQFVVTINRATWAVAALLLLVAFLLGRHS